MDATSPPKVGPPTAGRRSRARETALAAFVCGCALAAAHRLGADPGPPPAIRRVSVAVGEAPWYILAAVDGVGPRAARRLTSTAAVLRAAGFRADAVDLPAFGTRLLHRTTSDRASDAANPAPPR